MGDILALGLTHFPSLALPDAAWGGVARRMRADPAVPEALRTPAGWPPEMQEEYGDDQGATAIARHREVLVAEFRRIREEIEAFDPDYVLIWGDDQYENFQDDLVPPFAILAYDDLRIRPWDRGPDHPPTANVWGEPGDFELHQRFHRAGAKSLATDLLGGGFDVAYGYRPNHKPLSHSFLFSLLYLDYDRTGFRWPVVPFHVNCYGRLVVSQRGDAVGLSEVVAPEELDPPSPEPWRCFDLGAACARSIRESDHRVAIIASSGWSHAFLVRQHFHLYPDLVADRELFDALAAGDYGTWRGRSLADVERSGQQEMLNWMCLAGAMDELGYVPRHATFLPTYLFNSPKVFVVADGPGAGDPGGATAPA